MTCQDISVAGKQKGLKNEKGEQTRSGLFFEIIRIAKLCKPRWLVLENVAALLSRPEWMGAVLGSLAEIGLDCEWEIISAADMGAPHKRARVWIVAYPRGEESGRISSERRKAMASTGEGGQDISDSTGKRSYNEKDERIVEEKGDSELLSVKSRSSEDMGNSEYSGRDASEEREGIEEGSGSSKAGAEQASEPTGSGKQYEDVADSRCQGLYERRKPSDAEEKGIQSQGMGRNGLSEGKNCEGKIVADAEKQGRECGTAREQGECPQCREGLSGWSSSGKEMADSNGKRLEGERPDSNKEGREGQDERQTGLCNGADGDGGTVEQQFCRMVNELSEKLDRNNLTNGTPFGNVVSVISKELNDATSTKKGTNKALSLLQERNGTETVQRETGGLQNISEKEILQSGMHGETSNEGETLEKSNGSKSKEIQEEKMRKMPIKNKSGNTSQGWQRVQQRTVKSSNIMFKMPYSDALGNGGNRESEAYEFLLQSLRRACSEIEYVPETLSEIPKIWESINDEEKNWIAIRCATGNSWHSEWPNIPRVITGQKNRVSRLKCLGNAIVPQIAELIGRRIIEVENICQTTETSGD